MKHQYLNRVPLFNMTHPRMQRLPVDSKDLAQNCRKYLSTDKEMKTQQTNPYIKNRTKNLQLKKATQLLTQGQWWSIFRTQFPHIEQWWARSGLIMLHLSQYRTEPQTSSNTSTAVLTSLHYEQRYWGSFCLAKGSGPQGLGLMAKRECILVDLSLREDWFSSNIKTDRLQLLK